MKDMTTRFIEAQVDEGYIEALIEGWLEAEPYSIRIRKGFRTACWSFREGKHVVFVGDALWKAVRRALGTGDEHYVVSYLLHEISHSRETERDLVSLSKALKAEKIPFRFFNLAEDARIEELFRQKTGRLFRWAEFEEIKSSNNPSALLFGIIQQDGKAKGLEAAENFERVYAYYLRMVACANSWDLIPICKEWIEEFGENNAEGCPQRGSVPKPEEENEDSDEGSDGESSDEGSDGESSDEGSDEENEYEADEPGDNAADEGSDEFDHPEEGSDLEESLALEDDEAFEEAMGASEEIESTGDTEAKSGGSPHDKDTFEGNTVEIVGDCSNGTVRVPGCQDGWDKQEAEALAEQFKKLFRGKKVLQPTRKPTRRLNLRELAVGRFDNPFREPKLHAREKKRVCIIVDCSGSMRDIMPEMKIVLDAFNRLAHAGFVEGHVVLSGVNFGKALAETLALPMPHETVGQISAVYGAEGLSHAMETASRLLRGADWNIVLTDGMICDTPVDKDRMHKHGIRTLGIYLGDEDNCDLLPWFDYQIVEPSAKQIVDKMLRLLK